MSLTSPCCATRDGRATWRLGGDNDDDDDDDDDAGLCQLARRRSESGKGRFVNGDATDELQSSPSRTRRTTGMGGIREIAWRRAAPASLARELVRPLWNACEGSRYLCFAGGAVGEASGSGRCRVVVRGGGFFPFRVWWTGRAGLGCVVSGELRVVGQGEVLVARHVRSSLGRGSWGDEAGDEVPSDDYGRGLWRSGCGLEN